MPSSPSPFVKTAIIQGRYTVRRRLGSGSMGTVYLAFDEEAKRLVALKVIRMERLITDAVPRMQEEFRAVAFFRHPQIA